VIETASSLSSQIAVGDRVTYLGGYRMDQPLLGTVTRTGWELGGPWVEIQRDSHPDSPPCRLSVRGCQVRPA
jgi:hypothetical protein